MDISQPLGVGVAGHDNVRFFGQQGFKGVEELLLRALLVGKKLHVVNQEQIQRVVALLELVKSLALVGLNHIRYKLFCMDVENFGIGPLRQQPVAHSVHQMGLTQTNTAIDEERVVQVAWHARHMHGRGARHAVGTAFNQGVKGQRRIEPTLQVACARVQAGTRWVFWWQNIGRLNSKDRPDGGFLGSKR